MTSSGKIEFDELSALAAKAQSGDDEAYEHFLRGLYPWVRAVVRSRVGPVVDVEDLTQECILGVHTSLATYHPSRNIKPWINAIVRYKTIDYFRACARSKETPVPGDLLEVTTPHPDTNLDMGDRASDRVMVRVLVLRLPPALRQAILLTKFQGVSTEEAARSEGISPAALRKRVSRAYRKLASMMVKPKQTEVE